MKPNDLENHTAKSTTNSYNHTTMKWNHTKVVATYDRSPRTNWTEKWIFEITKGAYQKKGVAHQYVYNMFLSIFQFHIYLEPGVDIMKFSTPADCSFEGLWRSAIRSSHLSAIRVTKITLEWVDSFELEDSLAKTKLISEHTEKSNNEDWEPTPESLPTKSTCVIILSI